MMKKTISLIIIIILLAFISQENCLAASIKEAKISGAIVDFASRQAIEYANLVLINKADSSIVNGTISALDGSFSMDNIERGNYLLKIHFIGYQSSIIDHIEIKLKNEHIDLGTIELKPASINLKETEIIANNDYIDFKIDKNVINVKEHINAEGGTVVDALNNVPSVQVDAIGTVSLRGSTSFTLLIDGRPSVMTASNALNQIPASSVDKIEIITNPSVKHDAEGTSGIINLVMKKQKTAGTSGQATLSLATGDKYAANVLVNSKKNKFTSSIGASYSNKRKQTESLDERETYSNDSIYYQNIKSDRDIYRRNYKLNGGLIYDANKSNSFSLNAEIGQWEFDRSIDSKIQLSNNNLSESRLINSNGSFVLKNIYASGDAAYSHQFNKEEHQIDIGLFFSSLQNETPNYINSADIDSNGQELLETTNYLYILSQSIRNHTRFKVDYTLPISDKLKLEAGYQSDHHKSTTDYRNQFRFSLKEDWNTEQTLSGEMGFSRTINSAYSILSTQIKGIDVQGGIRLEDSQRLLQQKEIEKDYKYHALDFFPSLHLAKSLKNNQQISLSYSRRINRPNEWMLLPALNSTGRNMLQIGNPELTPDFTNSFQLGYNMRNKVWMLSAELYMMNTQNSIITTMVEKNKQYYQSYENLKTDYSSGVDLMSNINICPWWRINLSANMYYNKLVGTLKSGYKVDDAGFAWNGRFRTTFIVKKKTFIEFLTVYYGPSILAQGKSQDFYYFDFFIRRNFFNRKLTMALRSHNTFNTGIYIEDKEGIGFKAHTWFKYEGPTFMISLTYRLNNFKKKRAGSHLDMNYDSGLDR